MQKLGIIISRSTEAPAHSGLATSPVVGEPEYVQPEEMKERHEYCSFKTHFFDRVGKYRTRKNVSTLATLLQSQKLRR